MNTLLEVAELFIKSIDYQIKKDLNSGDIEGANLKELTKLQVERVIADSKLDDGRPCAMDVFTAHLINDCHDHFDFRDAINEWNHGDWDKALAYLSKSSRNSIKPC